MPHTQNIQKVVKPPESWCYIPPMYLRGHESFWRTLATFTTGAECHKYYDVPGKPVWRTMRSTTSQTTQRSSLGPFKSRTLVCIYHWSGMSQVFIPGITHDATTPQTTLLDLVPFSYTKKGTALVVNQPSIMQWLFDFCYLSRRASYILSAFCAQFRWLFYSSQPPVDFLICESQVSSRWINVILILWGLECPTEW